MRERHAQRQVREKGGVGFAKICFHPVQIPAMMLDGSHVADWGMLAAPASSERRYRENAAGALINSNPEHEIMLINSLLICFLTKSLFLFCKATQVSLVSSHHWTTDQSITAFPEDVKLR